MASQRTVLISGATGLVGEALARALAARGDAVVGLTRSPERPHALFESLTHQADSARVTTRFDSPPRESAASLGP